MRIEKQQLVQDLQAFLGPDRNVILINYKGLDVDAFAELRRALEKLHAESHVVPNRLFLRAAAEAGCSELAQAQLKGETALVTAGEDPVQVAKELNAFMKAFRPRRCSRRSWSEFSRAPCANWSAS